MKILLSCLLILMLFADSSLSAKKKGKAKPTPKPDYTESRYEKFRRQHIDKHMTKKKCDSVMNRKNIFNNDNSCKKTDTFIVDNPAKVKRICEGIVDEKMMKSTETFTIVKCELKNTGARKPNCQYNGGLLTNRYLTVKCENKLPVHFDDDNLEHGF